MAEVFRTVLTSGKAAGATVIIDDSAYTGLSEAKRAELSAAAYRVAYGIEYNFYARGYSRMTTRERLEVMRLVDERNAARVAGHIEREREAQERITEMIETAHGRESDNGQN